MDKASLQPNPAGYRSLTPFVLVRGAAAFIEFLQGAFGAIESKRCTSPPPRWTARCERLRRRREAGV